MKFAVVARDVKLLEKNAFYETFRYENKYELSRTAF